VSGLCGMVSFSDGDQEIAETVRAMTEALASGRPTSSRAEIVQGSESCQAGRAGLGARPGPASTGGVYASGEPGARRLIAFHGRLFAPVDGVPPSAGNSTLLPALLRAYCESAPALLGRLRGDFLLAVWREEHRTLEVATDRFRVESAVYAHGGGRLLFASRMASLLAAGHRIPRTVNAAAVADVVTSSIIPTPMTILSSVRKLPPGTRLIVDPSGLKIEPYWDADFRQPSHEGRSRLTETVRRALGEATALRYDLDQSGETIGTFLSGGVDSTTVTGILHRLAPGRVRSFSIGFQESRFNEMSYARVAARALGVEHHEYFVKPEDALSALPAVLDSFDEPFANASAIPTYWCARFARDHGVTALYAGDGGDELFAGNERYASRRVFDRYEWIPRWARHRLLRPAVLAASGAWPHPVLQKARRFIERASLPYPERITARGLFAWLPPETLFERAFLEAVGRGYNPDEAFHRHFRNALAADILDREMYVDLKITISDNDILKVTRMTEAAGVGVRFPFLDPAVVDAALAIPARLRMERGRLRSFFKAAYADLLPPEVRTKRKHGFGLPIAPWLRSYAPLRDLIHDTLLGPRCGARGYFRRAGIEELLRRHESDATTYYGTILWNFVVLELWLERHGL
jgi:asparagine synthase (glutamine-hydrolysing)